MMMMMMMMMMILMAMMRQFTLGECVGGRRRWSTYPTTHTLHTQTAIPLSFAVLSYLRWRRQ